MSKNSLPEFVSGNSAPRGTGESWIIRLADPFVMFRPGQGSKFAMRLYCWPPEAQSQGGAEKAVLAMMQLAAPLSDKFEVEVGQRLPDLTNFDWDVVFDSATLPAPFLKLENLEKSWSGILDTGRRQLWVIGGDVGGGKVKLDYEPSFSTGPLPDARVVRELSQWWEGYVRTLKAMKERGEDG